MGRLKIFTSLYISTSDHESAANIDFEVTSKFYRVGKFTNPESTNPEPVNNEDEP